MLFVYDCIRCEGRPNDEGIACFNLTSNWAKLDLTDFEIVNEFNYVFYLRNNESNIIVLSFDLLRRIVKRNKWKD